MSKRTIELFYRLLTNIPLIVWKYHPRLCSNAWQFIVVDDKDTLKKLSLCKEQASQFIADAALAVVVICLLYTSDAADEL